MNTESLPSETETFKETLGVVLCGGRSTRMGGIDKGLLTVCGQPMVVSAINALANCQQTVINTNRQIEIYQQQFSVPVIDDGDEDFRGPLAGMLVAMHYARQIGLNWVLTAPCDSPRINKAYTKRMHQVKQQSTANIYVAYCEGFQPVFALLNVDLLESLTTFLQKGNRKIMQFYQQVGYHCVDFETPNDFININTLTEKQRFESSSSG